VQEEFRLAFLGEPMNLLRQSRVQASTRRGQGREGSTVARWAKRTARLGSVAALAASFALAPVAAPALAATSKDQCTVRPWEPVFQGNYLPGHKKVVNYRIGVECVGGRDIEVEQKFFERNIVNGVPVYSYQGSSSSRLTAWWPLGLKAAFSNTRVLPYADPDNDDEVLQKVRFRVSSFGVTGNWTSWESSPVISIQHL
jgi:hypothetical protein